MQSDSSLPPIVLAPLDGSRVVARRRFRRLLGGLLGLGLGFLIGLVSQEINPLLVPSISFYQPPFGALVNILLATAIGGILGMAITWPSGSVNGVLLGAVVAGAMLAGAVYVLSELASGLDMGGRASLGLLLLPLAGMAIPLTLIFRLAVNRAEEARRDPPRAWQAIALPAALVLAAVLIGLTAMVPPAGRVELLATRQLIDANMGSATLPVSLKPPYVRDFPTRAQGTYRLEWTNRDLNTFAIPRGSLANESEHAVVVAHFENGYWLACLYEGEQDVPTCRDWLPRIEEP